MRQKIITSMNSRSYIITEIVKDLLWGNTAIKVLNIVSQLILTITPWHTEYFYSQIIYWDIEAHTQFK